MANPGDIIRIPQSGETFKFIETSKQTEGNSFKFEWTVAPGGQVPFEHIHPVQDEIFTVVEGEATFMLDGKESVARKGDTVRVKAGQKHSCGNRSDTELKVMVEFYPAHATELGFETICGLATDGKANSKGDPGLLAIATFADKYPNVVYLAGPPIPVQKAMFWVLARIGRLMGKKATYKKYSGFDS